MGSKSGQYDDFHRTLAAGIVVTRRRDNVTSPGTAKEVVRLCTAILKKRSLLLE